MATKIDWTDETWNPIVGCSKCSAGCDHCYAEKMAFRLANMNACAYREVVNGYDPKDDPKAGKWNGKTAFVESALSKPLHWRTPRKIFVCSMGDLFHESVPFEWIDKVFAVMALCPQHTFQVLTKRPERMLEWYKSPRRGKLEAEAAAIHNNVVIPELKYWPLPNVWLGVTAENQEMAGKRIPILLQTPAALRFVRVEPMLGAVDIIPYIGGNAYKCKCEKAWHHTENNRLQTHGRKQFCLYCETYADIFPTLDWVIVGAESGARRRKCDHQWALSLVKQCKAAGVACFVKQLQENDTGKNKVIKDLAPCWPREFPEG